MRFRRFVQPTALPRGSRSESVTREVREPFLGMRTDKSRHALRPGESGDMENFLVESGRLRNRPSASSVTRVTNSEISLSANRPTNILFAHPAPDEQFTGNEYAGVVGFSLNTTSNSSLLGYRHTSGWTNLVQDSAVTLRHDAFYDHAFLRAPDLFDGDFSWIATGHDHIVPFVGNIDDFSSAVTPLENFSSVASGARFVTAYDDRVLFAYEGSGAADIHPNRVRWTARGTATDVTSVGAGFEDLNAMRGPITALHSREDRVLIFGGGEIWVATPRRDDYAFSFDRLDDAVGCRGGRHLVDTPHGAIWLHNHVLYRLSGNAVRPISRSLAEEFREYRFVYGADGSGVTSIAYSHSGRVLLLFAGTSTGDSSSVVYVVHMDSLSTDPTSQSWDEAVWTKHSVPLEGGKYGSRDPTSPNALVAISDAPTSIAPSGYFELRDPLFLPWVQSSTSVIFQRFSVVGSSNETAHYTTHIPEGARDSRRFDLLREVGLDYEVVGSDVSVWIGVSDDVGDSYTTVGSGLLPSGRSHVDVAITPTRARNPVVKVACRTSDSSSTVYLDRITFEGRAWTGRR